MSTLLDTVESKLTSIADKVESVSDVATTLIETISKLIGTLNSIVVPVVLTLICINALNMGVVIWCIDRPQYNSHVTGNVNNGTLGRNDNSGERECKINVQYKVDSVIYDYTFTTRVKNNYINKEKVKIYYNRDTPEQPSLVENKPIRGKIIIAISVLTTGIAWLGWYLI